MPSSNPSAHHAPLRYALMSLSTTANVLFFAVLLPALVAGDSPSPTPPWRIRCWNQFRNIDGSCTSSTLGHGGMAGQLEHTYFPNLTAPYTIPDTLPSARTLSNILCDQKGDIPSVTALTDFSTSFSQFLDHDLGVTLEDKSSMAPIYVQQPDQHFPDLTQLPFHRSVVRGTAGEKSLRRPVNHVTGAIDLSALYGSDVERSKALREFRGGRLKHGVDNLLQTNTYGMHNAPAPTDDFFFSGDHRANEHPMLTALHVIFSREHNRLAKELAAMYPRWVDNSLFQVARAINIAQMQHIVYEEYFHALTGRKIPVYDGHWKRAVPQISVSFSTAAFRIGHSMVNEVFQIQRERGGSVEDIPIAESFFRNASFLRDVGVEAFLRPTFVTVAQDVDLAVVDGLRNALFKSVRGQTGLDLAASNIHRGRDHGLPSFNELRVNLGLPAMTSFRQISSNPETRAKLRRAYGSVDLVEMWPGLLAEDKLPGGAIGRTSYLTWLREFLRMRRADRFFYRGGFRRLEHRLRNVESAKRVLEGRVSMRDILLRNSDLKEDEVPIDIWHIR